MADLDSWIMWYDEQGVLIAQNDDGSFAENGSTSSWDSFLSATLINQGLFNLSVGRYNTANGHEAALKKNQD